MATQQYPYGNAGTYNNPLFTINSNGTIVDAVENERFYCLAAGSVTGLQWKCASGPSNPLNPFFSTIIPVPAYVPGTTLIVQPILGSPDAAVTGGVDYFNQTFLYGVLQNWTLLNNQANAANDNGFYVVAQFPGTPPAISFTSLYYAVFANPSEIPGPFPAPYQVIEAQTNKTDTGNFQTQKTILSGIPENSYIFTQLITNGTPGIGTPTLFPCIGNSSQPQSNPNSPFTPGQPNFTFFGSGKASAGNTFSYMILSKTSALPISMPFSARTQYAVAAQPAKVSSSVGLVAPLLNSQSSVFTTPITSSNIVGTSVTANPNMPPITTTTFVSLQTEGVDVVQVNIQGLPTAAGLNVVGVTNV